MHYLRAFIMLISSLQPPSSAKLISATKYNLVASLRTSYHSFVLLFHLLSFILGMESMEHIIIVGAGIAGLTTALGLHRLGIRSLVLESSDSLRATGFALTTWTNAWKALDAIGICDCLREQHKELLGVVAFSTVTGLQTAESLFGTTGTQRNEVRCVQRKTLLETLEKELPQGTIRYSSKVVSVEESKYLKLLHLADGSVLKAKVLIGCDGVNSAVAKWLGFKKLAFAGRSAIRGYVHYENGHGFESRFLQYFGDGIRFGSIPCDDKTMYWFFTWSTTNKGETAMERQLFQTGIDKDMEENLIKMKQFVLGQLGKFPHRVRAIVEKTNLDSIMSSPLRFRHPWELLWGNISKGNVCVTGDAFHPMTPDIGQGGCAALEDGVVLARCLGEALQDNPRLETDGSLGEGEEYKNIEMALKKYAKERRWRAIELISKAYIVGYVQQSNGRVLKFLRDKVLAKFLVGLRLNKASYDCGKLGTYLEK